MLNGPIQTLTETLASLAFCHAAKGHGIFTLLSLRAVSLPRRFISLSEISQTLPQVISQLSYLSSFL